jgi:hypothetical protein
LTYATRSAGASSLIRVDRSGLFRDEERKVQYPRAKRGLYSPLRIAYE